MAMMADLVVLAANQVSTNVLAGKLYESAPDNSAVRVYCTSTVGDTRSSFSVGGQAQIDDDLISAANRFPVVPDDLCLEVGAYAGEKLLLRFRAITACTVKWLVVLEPV